MKRHLLTGMFTLNENDNLKILHGWRKQIFRLRIICVFFKKMNYWLMFKHYNPSSLCFLLPIFKVDDCPNNKFKILILQETAWKLYGLPFIWIGAWGGISDHLVYTLTVASTYPLIWKWIHGGYFYFEAMALSVSHLTSTYSFPILL